MNNAVGRADIFALLERGITVGIGTDGMTPDLRRETMTGYLMHKHHTSNNNLGWVEFEQMILKNNPAIFQRLTGQMVGHIETGWLADMILVDYFPPTPLTVDNFWGHFLFGLVDAAVDTTIVNGRDLMHNKQISHLDEAEITAASRFVAERVWQKYHQS
jgi:cytosine/adenosine deaminase-related metal-dependent hydrolase